MFNGFSALTISAKAQSLMFGRVWNTLMDSTKALEVLNQFEQIFLGLGNY